MYDFAIDTDGDSVNDLMQLDSDGDGCFDVIEAGYLEEDSDGIYGEDPNPNIADGTVDEKGRINDADYDYTIEPRKDANGQFYFQTSLSFRLASPTFLCQFGLFQKIHKLSLDPHSNPHML